MKNDVTGKPLGTDLDKLRMLADEDIALDEDTPYDPTDPAAVEGFWAEAIVTPGGGVDATLAALRPEARYALVAEGGLRTASQADRASLSGSQWRALQKALDEAASYTATLRACAPVAAELKPQLRAVLQYHCGSPVLRTRQLMMDLQSL